MSSKITGFDNRPVNVGGDRNVERSANGKGGTTPAASVSPPAQDVQLTGGARQMAALEKALAEVPEVDMNRVEQLRSAIESGSYQVNAERVATKLVDMERGLASIELKGR